MKPYYGEQAFPQKEPLTSDCHGMSLRDYFAAKAMVDVYCPKVRSAEK